MKSGIRFRLEEIERACDVYYENLSPRPKPTWVENYLKDI